MILRVVALIAILSSSVIAGQAGLSLNTAGCQTQSQATYYTLFCPSTGGSGHYSYQYTQLPQGWFVN